MRVAVSEPVRPSIEAACGSRVGSSRDPFRWSELTEVIQPRGAVEGVRTKEGQIIRADILGYAIGVRPRKDLAEASGLKVERGVLVNEILQTSQPDIFAAGDVAQVVDACSGESVLNTLWTPAREQGRLAGLNMAGCQQRYCRPAPVNVTRLAKLTTTIIGKVGSGIDRDLCGIARGDSETFRQLPDAIVAQSGFDVNRLRLMVGHQALIGAIVMGDQTLSRPLQELVLNEVDITPIRAPLLRPDAHLFRRAEAQQSRFALLENLSRRRFETGRTVRLHRRQAKRGFGHVAGPPVRTPHQMGRRCIEILKRRMVLAIRSIRQLLKIRPEFLAHA